MKRKPVFKVNYRKIILFVAFILLVAISLSGCKSSDYEDALSLYQEGIDKGYLSKLYSAWERFDELGDYKNSREMAQKCKDAVLNDSQLLREELSKQKESSKYVNPTYSPMLSYDDLYQHFESIKEPVICEGGKNGYYDAPEHRSELVEEDYWYDPLGKHKTTAGVGAKHIRKQYFPAGDLVVEVYSSVFFGTGSEESANSLKAELFYKGECICYEYHDIEEFLQSAETGNTFAADSVLYRMEGDTLKILFTKGLLECNKNEASE